ncbi:MAG: carbohydrate porin, partial [Dokdonella sp.]
LFNLGGEAGRDVTAFVRYAFSAGHATSIDRMWNLGLLIRGPLASRPNDSLAMGWTSARLAPKWRAVQTAAGIDTVAAEEALEITWRAAITQWFQLQPNFQYIRRPGGAAAARNATLIGARVELTF